MKLDGRVAIVTGGAVRLGRAMALAVARAGMHVCVHYGNSAEEAERTVREIRELGRQAIAVSADFSAGGGDIATGIQQVLDQTRRQLGPADVLVNSAAIFEPASLATVDVSHFERHVRINMLAPLLCAQAFVAQLDDQAAAHIVNIVDWRALRPPPGHLVYTMTKAALVALTKMLAQELAPRVRVNGIAPGAILPPPGADAAEYEQTVVSRVPLRTMGGVADVTEALIYLLKSEFQTGEILCITGGEHL